QLAHATLGGAAAMLSESGLSSRELREMVVSPGGTTQAGLTSLDSLHFRDAVIAAVEAATPRARELAAASTGAHAAVHARAVHAPRCRSAQPAPHLLLLADHHRGRPLLGEPRPAQSDRALHLRRDRARSVSGAPQATLRDRGWARPLPDRRDPRDHVRAD